MGFLIVFLILSANITEASICKLQNTPNGFLVFNAFSLGANNTSSKDLLFDETQFLSEVAKHVTDEHEFDNQFYQNSLSFYAAADELSRIDSKVTAAVQPSYPIPEPSTMISLITGLLGLGRYWRRDWKQ
jgi:hypothetical protein